MELLFVACMLLITGSCIGLWLCMTWDHIRKFDWRDIEDWFFAVMFITLGPILAAVFLSLLSSFVRLAS